MMKAPGSDALEGFWLDHGEHRDWLMEEAVRQLDFFAASPRNGPGFHTLDSEGLPLSGGLQELHTTTRLVHSYALGAAIGHHSSREIIDRGLSYISKHHRDKRHGGFLWALDDHEIADDRKLAYGHVFVLLAASSAKMAGHPDADVLLSDVSEVLDTRFWEDDAGLFADEWTRDWQPFSDYRGMNANMHGVEALLTAFEATGERVFLDRAGRILDLFVGQIAPKEDWRLPEHYRSDWSIDRDYEGNPMFRPGGTTPGHSFEFGRLVLQHWDLSGRPEGEAPQSARRLIEQALSDAWLPDGGFAYTLDFQGNVDRASRFWWPVTEGIGALAALIKLERNESDEMWYRRLWSYAASHHVDFVHGGWFPEIDQAGRPLQTIFAGKPDIYHSLQACLHPLSSRLSSQLECPR